MTDPAPVSLFARLHAAQREIGGIKPDGENQFHKYKYVKAETLISEVGYMLRHHGLVLVASSFTVAPTGLTVQDKNGQVLPVIKCSRTLKLVDVATGEYQHHEIDWFVSPDAGRPIDKACGVASTAALGYFLRDLLLIPRTDGDPNDDEWDRKREEAETRMQKVQQQKGPPMTEEQRVEIDELRLSLKMNAPALIAFCGGAAPSTAKEAWDVIAKLQARRDAEMEKARKDPPARSEVKPEAGGAGGLPPAPKPTASEILMGLKADLDHCNSAEGVSIAADRWTEQIKTMREPQQRTAFALCTAKHLRLKGSAPVKGSPEEAAEAVLASMAAKGVGK